MKTPTSIESARMFPRSCRGSVLVIVLWVSVGLLAITLTFGRTMMMSYRSADNALAGYEAEQAIEGALRYVENILRTNGTSGAVPDPTSYEVEDVPVGEASFWVLGRSQDTTDTSQPAYGLVDEASKLNLNRATVEMLEALPGMTPELAAAIKDWRDTDDEVTADGAESETYLLKRPAYSCKNAPFESVEELFLVNGADETILYGEDANLNGVLDRNEDDADKSAPTDNGNGKLEPGIFEYVTAFSREPSTRSDGSPRVNAGGRSAELTTYLTEKLPGRAAAIEAALPAAGGIRSLLEFALITGMTSEEIAKVQGDLTFGAEDNVGLINVNTASEAVLACIPGIGTSKAAELIAKRAGRDATDSDFSWISTVLSREEAILAGPYVTGRSFQYSADIAAVGHHGRGYRRTRFIIDMSTGTPRVIHRRNLAPLGWALGSDVRALLAERKERR